MLIAIVFVVGCGGGGGGGQSSSVTVLPSDMVGTYLVQGIGLPNDQLGVQSDGDVVVNADSRAGSGGTITRIGTCSPQGIFALNGSWRAGGTDYTINANGELRPQNHSLVMQATVTGGNGFSCHDAPFSGDRVSNLEVPPPPPGANPPGDGGDIESPPPPPGDDPGPEMPPPPPSY